MSALNDDMEHKMTVLEEIILFGWRNFSQKRVLDSWMIRKLKRKKYKLTDQRKKKR
jgi:hypothetical protein